MLCELSLDFAQHLLRYLTSTQQNAAMVEETSAATHALADEVTELVRLVGQFVFNRRHKVRDSGEDIIAEAPRSLSGKRNT